MAKLGGFTPTPEMTREQYLAYIEQYPEYQKKLAQVQQDYTPRGWIRSPVHLPRFTSDEFEAQRKAYQAKYGSRINPPEFDEIFQWNVPPTISTEEYAAHKAAQAMKIPSPLDEDQLKYLKYKKIQFLKMLQSPEKSWVRDIGSIITSIDAAEQALNAAYVIGRLALHAAPELLKGLVPVLGWMSLGYDIMNLFDIYTQIGATKYAKKRLTENIHEKNPFSEEAWARRTRNLSKTWPSLGEIIQIAHTADHMFGIGLSLGATMAFANDVFLAGVDQVWTAFNKTADTIVWPEKAESIWADALKTLGSLWSSKDVWEVASMETLGAMGNMAVKALIPWWLKNEPQTLFPGLAKKPYNYPQPKQPWTLDNLDQAGIDPLAPSHWPISDVAQMSVQDLADFYAPKIKDNFQTYSLKNQYSLEGFMVGHQVTEFNQSILQAFSDDGNVQIADVATTAAAKNMARADLSIGDGSPQNSIQQLGEWIDQYERSTGTAPSAKEIKIKGTQIGIKWSTGPRKQSTPAIEKLFPGWGAMQDQLGKIHTPDYK